MAFLPNLHKKKPANTGNTGKKTNGKNKKGLTLWCILRYNN